MRNRVNRLNSKPMKMKLDASSATTKVYICAKRMLKTRCGPRGVAGLIAGDCGVVGQQAVR